MEPWEYLPGSTFPDPASTPYCLYFPILCLRFAYHPAYNPSSLYTLQGTPLLKDATMPPIFRLQTLPENLLPIICDHYADKRQLRALSTVAQLNHRISNHARVHLYRQVDFADDRSSRNLGNANELCRVYEDGDLLDADILGAIDCEEIDPLDLDLPLRWLRGMRTCEIIVMKDLLYGRDVESLWTLATSLSERGLVLFPNVKQVTISAVIVKRILATEAKGPRPKETPVDLLVTLFHATRPRVLCVQDSAIFTPPPRLFVKMLNRQENVGGRLGPSRRGHMSHTTMQWIQGMAELEEIRYHEVKPDVSIYPKNGIRHVVSFTPDSEPPVDILFGRHRTCSIVGAIKDIIQRSVVGSPRFRIPSPQPLLSGENALGSAAMQSAGGVRVGSSAELSVGGDQSMSTSDFDKYTSTTASPSLFGGFGAAGTSTPTIGRHAPTSKSPARSNFGNPATTSASANALGVGGSESTFDLASINVDAPDRYGLFGASSTPTTTESTTESSSYRPSSDSNAFVTGDIYQVGGVFGNPLNGGVSREPTTVTEGSAHPAGSSSVFSYTNPTASLSLSSSGNTLPHYHALSAQYPTLFGMRNNALLHGGGQASQAGPREKEAEPPMYQQSTWRFVIPGGKREMERVKKDIMNWAEGFGCDLGKGIREGITFGVKEEEGKCGYCGC